LIHIPRWLVATLALAFSMYHLVVGAYGLVGYENRGVGVAALLIYFLCVSLSITAYPGLILPRFQGVLNIGAAVAVPSLVNSQISTDLAGSWATWYVGGIGILLAITAVRGRAFLSWLGFIALLGHVVLWGGVGFIGASGIVGAFLYISAGQGMSRGLNRTSRQAQEFREQASSAAVLAAQRTVLRIERQQLFDKTLKTALPTLRSIVARAGKLNAEERSQALILEAQLRDEIRGRKLLSTNVRDAALQARARGVSVLFLDDGGLDGVFSSEVDEIHDKIATAIHSVLDGRITVRAVRGETFKVTVVASRAGTSKPDLWLKFS
jgi:hypothetical protein